MGRMFKIFVGILLLIAGLYWYTKPVFLGTTATNWDALIILFKGGFGIFLFLIGLILTWIEIDEMRLEKELEQQDFDTAVTAETVQEAKEEEYYDKERVEEDEDETVYECGECGRSFDSERGLHIHQSRSH